MEHNKVKSVRVGGVLDPPYVNECFIDYPKFCPNPGMDIEFIYSVIVGIIQLNVSFSIYESRKEAIQALNNNVIDMVGNSLNLFEPTVMNFYRTPTYTYEELAFIVYCDENSAMSSNIFTAFSMSLWISLSIISAVIFCLKIFLDKSVLHLSKNVSTFVYNTSWFLMSIFVIELYGNLLAVNLIAHTENTNWFKDLDDLGKKLLNRQCRFLIHETDKQFYVNIFAKQNRSWTTSFVTALNGSSITVKNAEDVYNTIKNNSSCLVGIDVVFPQTEFPTSFCGIDVLTFPSEIPILHFVFVHSMQSLSSILDNVFTTDAVSSFATVLKKKYSYVPNFQNECLKTNSNIQISLTSIGLCFIFLISGIFLVFSWHVAAVVVKKNFSRRVSRVLTINKK